MKKYQDNKTQTGQLPGVLSQITALTDVERIYLHFERQAGICQTVLTILVEERVRPAAELFPLVSAVLDKLDTFHFTLHPFHQVAQAVSKGNLYFCSICSDERLVYAKKDSNYLLPAESVQTKQILDQARRVYELESSKIKTFTEGADFYFDKQNYAQSAFMLHQAIELNYRALEQFLTGKSKITHSIRAHQKFLKSYHTGINSIFSENNASDIEHLKLLDDAYLAVRYENNYHISQMQVLALRVKSSEVKTAALKTLLTIIEMQNADTDAKQPLKAIDEIEPVTSYPQVPVSLTEMIQNSFDVKRIYCFGKRTYKSSRSSCFQDNEQNQKEKDHFDLLIISSVDPAMSTSDLQSRINDDTESPYTALLLGCTAAVFKRSLHENNRFFHTVLNRAELVFTNGEPDSEGIVKQYDQTRMLLDCKVHWNQRHNRSTAFIAAMDAPFEQGEETVVLSLISQGVEQICLGLISVFLGYQPVVHSLNHLFDLCSNFTPLIREIFPSQTKLDKDLLKILGSGARNARYLAKLSPDPTDTGVLYQRFQLLIEQSSKLVQEHLEKTQGSSKELTK